MPQQDVATIRQVRNELIHARSASIDEVTFNTTWIRVEQALLKMSRLVSPSYETDTQNILQALKDKVVDPAELDALKQIMIDHRDYDILREVLIFPILVLVPILTVLLNSGFHMQRVWHANRGRLLLRTPGPV